MTGINAQIGNTLCRRSLSSKIVSLQKLLVLSFEQGIARTRLGQDEKRHRVRSRLPGVENKKGQRPGARREGLAKCGQPWIRTSESVLLEDFFWLSVKSAEKALAVACDPHLWLVCEAV